MKILSKILLLVLLCLFALNSPANSQTAGERIKAKRIAFFTDRLQLTPGEAQKFWPVFNEYDLKKNALSAEKRKLTETIQSNSDKISEGEVDKIINRFIQISQQETQLFEAYNKRFRSILPAQKVMKLYLAETEFKVILLRELKANSKNAIAE